jgi:hypothetical protein
MSELTRDMVAGVMVCADVEVWTSADDERRQGWDRATRDDYLSRLTDVVGKEWADAGEAPEESEHDVDVLCWAGKVVADMTLAEWLQVANNLCIDIEDGQVLPDRVDDTMGVLTGQGVVPAVSIPGTDEGWNMGHYDPQVIASFYVSVMLHDETSTDA